MQNKTSYPRITFPESKFTRILKEKMHCHHTNSKVKESALCKITVSVLIFDICGKNTVIGWHNQLNEKGPYEIKISNVYFELYYFKVNYKI